MNAAVHSFIHLFKHYLLELGEGSRFPDISLNAENKGKNKKWFLIEDDKGLVKKGLSSP